MQINTEQNLPHLTNWHTQHGAIFVFVCVKQRDGRKWLWPCEQIGPALLSPEHTPGRAGEWMWGIVYQRPSDTSHNWSIPPSTPTPTCECNKWSAIRPGQLIIEMECGSRFSHDNQRCWRKKLHIAKSTG